MFVAIAFHLFFELFELFQGFLDPPDLLLGLEGLPLLGGSRAVLGVLGRLEVSKDFNDLGQPTVHYSVSLSQRKKQTLIPFSSSGF